MQTLNDIVETFELLGDWEQRYEYLVQLGEQLPPMPESLKTERNKVKGCMSQVWVHAYAVADGEGRIRYHGDCDTSIIKGVLALLIRLSNDKHSTQIAQLDVDEIFTRLQLDEHLSPQRHIGVYAIVELMKAQARALDEKHSTCSEVP